MQPSEQVDAAHATSGNLSGGRFDFDDGGTYCGGWDDGKAHGYGVCTGPKGQGAYAGSWHFGFEVSGVYTWPSGSSYEGQWQNGKRHGLGVETRGRWVYRGEWTQGCKGRYGVRQSTTSNAKYEGTYANGLQDGYGLETYADSGTYLGQWMAGMRHGYGVRVSAPFGLASHHRGGGKDARGSLSSLTEVLDPSERRTTRMDDARGGFVLKANSDEPSARRGSLVEKTKKGLLSKLRKPRSVGELDKRGTGGSVRSGGSGGSGSSWLSSGESTHSATIHGSVHTDSNHSFTVEDEHLNAEITETYTGEWKNDKRTGFGISERSDGLQYEGEWFANRKYGYGVTTFRDGTKEEGKYKNNVLITSQKRKHIFLMRSTKFRERVDSAVAAAQRASKVTIQKADIATSRTAMARSKSEQAEEVADIAKEDCNIARKTAEKFAPDFKIPGFDRIGLRDKYRQKPVEHQVPLNPQDTEKVLDGNSIPNHIPPTHPQYNQSNKISNAISPRRPSTQYGKDSRLPNNTNFNPADRPSGPVYENANSQNNSSSGLSQNPDQQRNYIQNEQSKVFSSKAQTAPQPPFRLNRQDAVQQQQSIDQNRAYLNQNQAFSNQNQESINQNQPFSDQNQKFSNQTRRLSDVKQSMNHKDSQKEWVSHGEPVRRQSVLGQPTYDAQGNFIDNGTGTASYGRHEYRSGVYSEGQPPPLAQDTQYRQSTESQGYRQNLEQNTYKHHQDQQVHRQGLVDQQNYRQHPTNELDGASSIRDPRPTGNRISIDYFDHYKRPPSRDSSVDRYGRRSRQPSVEAGTAQSSSSRAGSVAPQPMVSSRPSSRAATPAGNGHLASGRGSISRAGSRDPPPFEDSLLRKRTLGQEIFPSPYHPKRTESLYVAPNPVPTPPVSSGGGGGGRKILSTPQTLQRKKSLPDVAALPGAGGMSREEVSALGSARREEVRRMHEETEKLRANPLLYLVSPQVKDWFHRQQLVILVLFINISLGIMFYKLLT